MLGLPVLGVIPESEQVLSSTNVGIPAIQHADNIAGEALQDMVERLLGNDKAMRFLVPEPKVC